MTNPNPAPLSAEQLDKLEMQVQRAYMADARFVAFLAPATILDLIAQARTSQPAGAADTTVSASGSIEDYAQFHTLLGSWISMRDYYQYDGAPQVTEAWRKFIDYIDSRATLAPVAAQQAAAKAPAAQAVDAEGWISVKDRLPPRWGDRFFSQSVLIADLDSNYPHVRMSELNYDEDGPTVWSGADPTHWKPAPALPAASPASTPEASQQAHHAAATTGEDARDAARYRWLRDKARDAANVAPIVVMMDWRGTIVADVADDGLRSDAQLDEAMDKAMSVPNAIQNNEGNTNV